MTFIYKIPVEIIQDIFRIHQDSILQEFDYHDELKRQRIMASGSPVLALGAVCKGWKAITLECPRLWTEIVISLCWRPNSQVDIVKTWAKRSGSSPLHIKIFGRDIFVDEVSYQGRLALLDTVKSFADRWGSIEVDDPQACYNLKNLFDGLAVEGPLPLKSLHVKNSYTETDEWYTGGTAATAGPSIHLKRFTWTGVFGNPPESQWNWTSLVDLRLDTNRETALYMIKHAAQLKYCRLRRATWSDRIDSEPHGEDSRITHRSLTDLTTNLDILGYLTLPSLSKLQYIVHAEISVESLESIARFLERLLPSKLKTFNLHFHETGWNNSEVLLWSFLQRLSQPQANVVVKEIHKLSIAAAYIDGSVEFPQSSLDSLLSLWRDGQQNSHSPWWSPNPISAAQRDALTKNPVNGWDSWTQGTPEVWNWDA